MNTPTGATHATTFETAAPVLAGLGYHVIPCKGKKPVPKDWPHWRLQAGDQIKSFKDCNTGIVLGEHGLVALDIDVLDHKTVRDLIDVAHANIFTGVAPIRVGKAPKVLLLFRVSGAPQRKRKVKYEHGTDAGAIELLGEGQQFVAYGTHPDTGLPYHWDGTPLHKIDITEIPVIDPERLDLMWQALQDTMTAAGWVVPGGASTSGTTKVKTINYPTPRGTVGSFPADVLGSLDKLDPGDRDTWVNVGHALRAEADRTGEEWPRDLWEHWSARSTKWKGWEVEQHVWESFKGTRAGLDNIAHWAGQPGFANEFDVVPDEPEGEPVAPGEVAPPSTPKPKSLKQLKEERANGTDSPWQLRPVDFDGLEDREIPEASFCLDGILPDSVVTLLAAHGGTGKSYIALMIAVAVAMGRRVLNRDPDPRSVLYYSCEEPVAVILLRLKRICRYYGIKSSDLLASGRLVIHNGFGESNVFFTGQREVENRLTKTYRGLLRVVKEEKFGLVIIDNSSEVYDASEIDRALVRQFIQSLNRFAVITGGAVMLIAHVDKATTTGENVTGYSGSTAWHNSVRSRWYLSSKGDQLLLAFQKSNYAELAENLQLEWRNDDKVFEVCGVVPKKKEVIVNEPEAVLKVIAAFLYYEGKGVVVPDTSTSTGNGVSLLMKQTGMKRPDVKETLNTMLAEKLLEKVDYKKTNRMHGTALTLTPEGRSAAVRAEPNDDDMLG